MWVEGGETRPLCAPGPEGPEARTGGGGRLSRRLMIPDKKRVCVRGRVDRIGRHETRCVTTSRLALRLIGSYPVRFEFVEHSPTLRVRRFALSGSDRQEDMSPDTAGTSLEELEQTFRRPVHQRSHFWQRMPSQCLPAPCTTSSRSSTMSGPFTANSVRSAA